MAYFGKVKPVETTGSVFRSTYTGDGSTTTYNLPVSVANEESIIATINGVTQQDSAYSTNGSQIIFSTAPALNDSIELRCISGVGLSYAPADGSVTTSKLADGTITTAKINDAAITAGKLASTLDLSGKAVTYGLTGSDMPAGSVLQVVQSSFNPSTEGTTSSSYQASSMNLTIQKNSTSNKIIIIMAGGHQYVTGFDNGTLSTICQEGGSSTFTATTTYSSGNDPASAYVFGMQQVYNQSQINTAPHSKTWLFSSTGSEFEAYRCFFRSRFGGRYATFHESGNLVTMTAMEIKA